MNFLDLFAGIGGFRLGMEQAGHVCVGHCEIDKFANTSYNAIHQPKEEEWSATDIRMVSDDDFRLLRGKVDCICGGFPCQAFSIAGKRRGFSDTRGTLFFEIARAAKQIQPRFLFLENVKGLLSHDKGETFATILATLDELGYDVQWECLNSKNFGVPQNRERVFIIGHLRGTSRPEVFPIGENDTIPDISKQSDEPQSQTQLCTTIGTKFGSRADDTFVIQRSRGNNKGGVHNISPTLTTNSFQDNNFVIQVGNIVENKDTFGGNPQRGRVYSPDGISPCLNCIQGGQREPKILVREATKRGYAEAKHGDSIDLERPNCLARRGRVGKGVSQTLTTQCGMGVVLYGINLHDSKEFAKPPLKDLARTLRANKTDSTVMAAPTLRLNELDFEDRLDRLEAEEHEEYLKDCELYPKGWDFGKFRIRKLTPRECWRLQGFPDWAFDRAKGVGVSDSQLYKQAGNSVTVNVIYEIARRFR